MLDTYVVDRLINWADYVQSGRKVFAKLWYPKKSCIANFNTVGNGLNISVEQYEQECFETEQCVLKLSEDLKAVIIACYLENSTVFQKAKRCGFAEEDYKIKLGTAHNHLLGLLNDYIAKH